MVARHAPEISPCYEVDDRRCGPWIPLDIDVSPFDNSGTDKEGVWSRIQGNVSRTHVPLFGWLVISICPPCASMIFLHTLMPKP